MQFGRYALDSDLLCVRLEVVVLRSRPFTYVLLALVARDNAGRSEHICARSLWRLQGQGRGLL